MKAELKQKRCGPCNEKTPPLKGEAMMNLLHELGNNWKVIDGRRLEKEYSFKDFKEALDFTNRVGAIAEQEGHHPDIYLGWGKVKLDLSTHSIGGLSENDFILAAKADAARR